MAILWVSRHFEPFNPLRGIEEAARQLKIVTLARDLNLKVEMMRTDDDIVDAAIYGAAQSLSKLIEKIYREGYPPSGFVVDADNGQEEAILAAAVKKCPGVVDTIEII